MKITDRLKLFLSDEFSPILNNHHLHGEYNSCRSINITGDVRVIYKKMPGEICYLLEIGTHSQLYE
jgi:addiction module RelE/StbE family toxin